MPSVKMTARQRWWGRLNNWNVRPWRRFVRRVIPPGTGGTDE